MANLTRKDIVNAVFDKTGIPSKYVRDAVQVTLDAIIDALKEGRGVELRNFGVFEIQIREPRTGRNPNKPQWEVEIPRRATVRFKAGKELKVHLQSFAPEKIAAIKEEQEKVRLSKTKHIKSKSKSLPANS